MPSSPILNLVPAHSTSTFPRITPKAICIFRALRGLLLPPGGISIMPVPKKSSVNAFANRNDPLATEEKVERALDE